jgi:hypothetical protein
MSHLTTGSIQEINRQERSVTRASTYGLLILCIIAVILFFVGLTKRFGANGYWTAEALIAMECGLVLFFLNCAFLLPKAISSRIMAPICALIVVLMQATTASREPPIFWVGAITVFVAFSVPSWFLQRLTGAGLSYGGQEITEKPLSLQFLVLLPLLVLAVGLIPTLAMFSQFDRPPIAFGQMLIYASMGLLLYTLFPMLVLYMWIVIYRSGWLVRGVWFLLIAVLITVSILVELNTRFTPLTTLFTVYFLITFSLGIVLGYIPFHLVGFRPVWAKRAKRSTVTKDVSFDDVE